MLPPILSLSNHIRPLLSADAKCTGLGRLVHHPSYSRMVHTCLKPHSYASDNDAEAQEVAEASRAFWVACMLDALNTSHFAAIRRVAGIRGLTHLASCSPRSFHLGIASFFLNSLPYRYPEHLLTDIHSSILVVLRSNVSRSRKYPYISTSWVSVHLTRPEHRLNQFSPY